jgi:hypothetical protein
MGLTLPVGETGLGVQEADDVVMVSRRSAGSFTPAHLTGAS